MNNTSPSLKFNTFFVATVYLMDFTASCFKIRSLGTLYLGYIMSPKGSKEVSVSSSSMAQVLKGNFKNLTVSKGNHIE